MPGLQGLLTFLTQLGQFLIGPLGLGIITVALAGGVIACLIFGHGWHILWRVAILCVLLVGVGAFANGIQGFAG